MKITVSYIVAHSYPFAFFSFNSHECRKKTSIQLFYFGALHQFVRLFQSIHIRSSQGYFLQAILSGLILNFTNEEREKHHRPYFSMMIFDKRDLLFIHF